MANDQTRVRDLKILDALGIEVAEVHGSDEISVPAWEGKQLAAWEGLDPLVASHLSSMGEDPSTYRRVECSLCGEVWSTNEEWEGVCPSSGGCGR